MKNLVKAVLDVMSECKGIDKSMKVGSGNSQYKGVADKEVKLLIGESMRKHGLVILPIDIQPITTHESWDETSQYGVKRKFRTFTELITKYRLIHDSGEEATLAGYGHGVDSQDKAAGKATTYALKYTLLYTFLVATGHIDDTDSTHSDDIPTPNKEAKKPISKPQERVNKMIAAVRESKNKESLSKLTEIINKTIESDSSFKGLDTEKVAKEIQIKEESFK